MNNFVLQGNYKGRDNNKLQRRNRGGQQSVSEGETGGRRKKNGEMMTHTSGKALIYSLCLFWVIYCGCMRHSISTCPL